jgi:CRP-like cAMP-binding protein
MYFQQADVLQGLKKDFIKEFMEIAKKETHKPGYMLFRAGDRANDCYILLRGRVKLTIGEGGHTVNTVDRAGEVFGWSSLVGRERYAASAECTDNTTLLRIDAGKLDKLIERDATSGVMFFKRLAASLGNRLLQTYRLIPGMAETHLSHSYGTGQVLGSDMRVA